MKITIWSVVAAVLCFLVLFWAIALLEERSAVKLKWKTPHQERLLLWMLGISAILVVLFTIETTVTLLLLLAFKIVVAKFVSDEAGKIGRNKMLWALLGFVEFHASLLTLSLRPQIVKMRKASQTSHPEIENKLEHLNQLFAEELIDRETAQKQLIGLLSEVNAQKEEVQIAIEKVNSEKKKELLRESLKMGLLTQEEFDQKIQAL